MTRASSVLLIWPSLSVSALCRAMGCAVREAGVIGTETGIKCFERWVEWVQRPVFNASPLLGRPPFPGFETVFRSRWNARPVLTLTVTVR